MAGTCSLAAPATAADGESRRGVALDFSGRALPPALRAPLDEVAQQQLDRLAVASYQQVYNLPACRLRALQAGKLAVFKNDQRTGVTIPILAYLLETPGGLFAIDAGLSRRWRDATEIHLGPDDSPSPGTPYVPTLDGPSMAEQLDNLGLRPDRLICTHLHEDHASGASDLGLTLEASAVELARLEDPEAEGLGYPVAELVSVAKRPIALDPGSPLGPFAATAELAPGVLAVDTSGHTPGSISVLACIGAVWALICGDAVYPRMDDPTSPSFLAMLRIRRALGDLPGLRPFPAHDTTVVRSGVADGWLGDPTAE